MLRLVTKIVRLEDTDRGTKTTDLVSLGSTDFPESKVNSPGTRLRAINQLDNLFHVISGVNLTDAKSTSTLLELILFLQNLKEPYSIVKLPNEFRIIINNGNES